MSEEQKDVLRLLSAKVHLGASKINHNMKKYVQEKNSVGNYIFNIDETYTRIKLAARIIASIPNPS
jgi:small subunit ribosomal protein SAe